MILTELAKDVYWISVTDSDIGDFRSHKTRRGTTYNAYLITDEETALADNRKTPFKDHNLE